MKRCRNCSTKVYERDDVYCSGCYHTIEDKLNKANRTIKRLKQEIDELLQQQNNKENPNE